jgi:hypothetical protein
MLAALPAVMSQLTELNLDVNISGGDVDVRLDGLMQLPHLRKLTMYGIRWTDERLTELKQLSQLRDLHILIWPSMQLAELFQPPHSLQLERISLRHLNVDEPVMRALFHLPTLTELDPLSLLPSAWPLLPQLPALRRLTIRFYSELTVADTTLLSTSLAACRALTELYLVDFSFRDARR